MVDRSLLSALKRLVLSSTSDTSLIALGFPPRIYKKGFQLLKGFLQENDLTPEKTLSDWPHVSIAFISDLQEDEKEKFKLAIPAFDTTAKITGLEILPGRADLDYIAFAIDFPGLKKLFRFAKDIVGDKIKIIPGFKPHISLLTVPKTESDRVHELLPEMEKIVNQYFTSFKPDQIQIWDHNFQISELEENILH